MKRSEILEREDYKEINKIELSRELTVILTGMGILSLFLFGCFFKLVSGKGQYIVHHFRFSRYRPCEVRPPIQLIIKFFYQYGDILILCSIIDFHFPLSRVDSSPDVFAPHLYRPGVSIVCLLLADRHPQ